MAALTSSDFTGATSAGSTITWTGTQVSISRPSTQNNASHTDTNTTYNSGIIIGQAKFSFAAGGGSADMASIMLTSSSVPLFQAYATTYAAKISSRNNTSQKYRLSAGAATWNSYDLDTSTTNGVDVKITYDTSNNNIKFWAWNGSSWTQMDTTQTYDIKNGGNVKLSLQNTNLFVDIAPVWDNIYFGTFASDYSTQFPPATTSIKTVLGLTQASVKTWNGLAIASVKTINGLA
jgi:hypothetical protein